MFAVPTEEPSIIFPIGAVIEDQQARYKVLEFLIQEKAHKYKCEVLQQKVPIPNHMKPFTDEKIRWVLVLPQNLKYITRIE